MKAQITGDSVRNEDGIMRFLVDFPELGPGYHGVQIKLPATKEQIVAAVKATYLQVQKQLSDAQALRTQFADIINVEIDLTKNA